MPGFAAAAAAPFRVPLKVLCEPWATRKWVADLPNTKPSKTGRDASVASLAQRLRQAEEACALAGTPELVQPWSIHDDRGRLLAMSERAARLLGHDPARDCGHFLDLVQVLDRVPLGQFLATVNLPAARDSGPMHFRPLRSGMQGAAGWVEISAGSEASPAEGCHIFSMRDVTRERETGEAAARLRSDLMARGARVESHVLRLQAAERSDQKKGENCVEEPGENSGEPCWQRHSGRFVNGPPPFDPAQKYTAAPSGHGTADRMRRVGLYLGSF